METIKKVTARKRFNAYLGKGILASYVLAVFFIPNLLMGFFLFPIIVLPMLAAPAYVSARDSFLATIVGISVVLLEASFFLLEIKEVHSLSFLESIFTPLLYVIFILTFIDFIILLIEKREAKYSQVGRRSYKYLEIMIPIIGILGVFLTAWLDKDSYVTDVFYRSGGLGVFLLPIIWIYSAWRGSTSTIIAGIFTIIWEWAVLFGFVYHYLPRIFLGSFFHFPLLLLAVFCIDFIIFMVMRKKHATIQSIEGTHEQAETLREYFATRKALLMIFVVAVCIMVLSPFIIGLKI